MDGHIGGGEREERREEGHLETVGKEEPNQKQAGCEKN